MRSQPSPRLYDHVVEVLRARFDGGQITVRDGKGRKDRLTMLPNALHQPLQEHLRRVRQKHEEDLRAGRGQAPLPDAPLARMPRNYPNAGREWGWQWVFPASSHYLDRRTGIQHRQHLHESVVQKAVHRGPIGPGWPSG